MAESINVKPKFTFRYLEGHEFNFLTNRNIKELLQKWSMYEQMKTALFNFDQQFQQYQKQDFFTAFFQSPEIITNLKVLSSSGSWVPLGILPAKVSISQVSCSLTSVEIFDRLYSEGVVHENGKIVKCFDEYYESIILSDELRKMLLMEDSDHYTLYSKEERSEFLFRIMQHLSIGGPICQYEDDVQPYIDTARAIYKDLLTVQRDKVTKKPFVTSFVYSLTALDDNGNTIFPSKENNHRTFCYAIVDPAKRYVKLWYYVSGGSPF